MAMSNASVTALQRPEHVAGRLHWYGADLDEIAERYGTPCHVGSEGALHASLAAFERPFRAAGLPLEVRFSIKTNPAPVVIDALRRAGAGFEAVSLREVRHVLSLGARAERVVVGGLHGGPEDALLACELGLELVTVSTPGQLARLLEQAHGLPGRLRVALGICPGLWRGRWDLTLNSGARGAAVGFRPGSRQLEQALDALRAAPRLELAGLHMHIGSGVRSAAPYARALRALERVVHAAALRGHHVDTIDIGGGFGLAHAPVMGACRTLATLLGLGGGTQSRGGGSLLDDVARVCARSFERLEAAGLAPRTLLAEPGRVVAGPSQLLLLAVTDVVDWGDGRPMVLCDGGAMAVSPMLVTEAHRVVALRPRAEPARPHAVLGNLPTSLDRIASSAALPPMEPGDRLAVCDTGAYFVSMNNTFGGPRLPIAWIEGGRARLARRREREDEITARDHLPRHLVVERRRVRA